MLNEKQDDWGLTQIQYAHREKQRARDRMRKRMQRAKIKAAPPMVCEYPVDNFQCFRLKMQDIQDLDILAYRKYVPNRTTLGLLMTAKGDGDWISLPYVSILQGLTP
ncbi:hypothetical protein CK227_10410 [Mesorhizobium sp. WSM4308]|uniref:hypothetical protein n=1 Tax=Mesorhizobium sp. WSM4308 TaxID=2029409 RepID=UPI000BAEF431|nr:hypothetical protein [Mesorhizobium sp. WSM4308]PBB75195.1 hypothetical protein CK227_10410 [Mesorhizobium sp. WSM4308]